MKDGFKNLQEYESHRPKYGSVKLSFDPLKYLQEANSVYESKDAKKSGRNNFNKFNSVGKQTKEDLVNYWNNQFKLDYDWTWEYFHSGEPAGLHTDYLSFPNSWKPNKDFITHDCYVVFRYNYTFGMDM